MSSGCGQLRGWGSAGCCPPSERYPRGGKPRGQRGAERPAWEAWAEASGARPGNAFSAPLHLAPLGAAPPPAARAAVSAGPGAGDRGGEGIPAAGGPGAANCANGRRFRGDSRRAGAKLRPFLPVASFIPQLPGRLVSASTDRARRRPPPRPSFRRLSLLPVPEDWGHDWRPRPLPSPPGAPAPRTPPPPRRSHPLRGSRARPDAANSSHLH